jgi:hypothetical protein
MIQEENESRQRRRDCYGREKGDIDWGNFGGNFLNEIANFPGKSQIWTPMQ